MNVLGVVHGCYYFLPKMIAAGGKRQVVIIASGAAHFPPPNAGAYGASKAAVFSFAESLKMDLTGTSIGVTTVCPGITNTGIVDKPKDESSPQISDAQRARMREYYAKKGAKPEDVAEAVFRGVQRGLRSRAGGARLALDVQFAPHFDPARAKDHLRGRRFGGLPLGRRRCTAKPVCAISC